jgi:hypothetical protein
MIQTKRGIVHGGRNWIPSGVKIVTKYVRPKKMKRITKTFLKQYAKDHVGGLSEPSKMPCYAWSFSTDHCITGGLLRKIEGSTCSKCYATRGNYQYPVVIDAHERRLHAYNIKRSAWVDAFTYLLNLHADCGEDYFRWFDSGDLQSVAMLEDIVQIARNVPRMQFWLPTREMPFIHEWYASDPIIPDNICIRFSAPMIGKRPAHSFSKMHERFSDSTVQYFDEGFEECPAPEQGKKCLDCRKCWDPEHKIGYHTQ